MKFGMTLQGNTSEFLAALGGEVERRVVRSATYAGAKVFYEEARRLAPVYDGPEKTYESGNKARPGLLRDSIYHAHVPEESVDGRQMYRVSWNHRKAPHGRLIEHGHWRVNKVFFKNGKWWATKERLETPVWVPPQSFIRRAGDASPRALNIMKDRSIQRVMEVLADIHVNGPLLSEE